MVTVLNQIIAALDTLGIDRSQALVALMSADDVLTAAKKLLGIEGEEQDGILLFVIQAIEGQMLRYINWETLPEELQRVLAVMVVSYYKSAGLGSTEATTGAVTTVRRGDVSTSFGTTAGSSGSSQTFNLGADAGDFFGWKTVLNEYRKLRW